MAVPRPSTDEESAPLLSREQDQVQQAEQPTLYSKLASLTATPLSFLAKILLGVCLFLLLLSSIFIGLFAGAQHKIEKSRNTPPTIVTATSTVWASVTHSQTETQILTTTAISVSTTTDVQTTTQVSTAPAPPIPTPDPGTIPCTDTECIVLAASILSSLDVTKDPCEDFYEYTTGGWLKEHPIPSDKGSFGSFEDVALRNNHVLREILETPIDSKADVYDLRTATKLQDMYQSCLNETLLDERGVQPLLDVLHTIKALFNGTVSLAEIDMLPEDFDSEEDTLDAQLIIGNNKEKKRQKDEAKRRKKEEKQRRKQQKKEAKRQRKEEKERQKEERRNRKLAEKIDTEGLTAALAYMHSRDLPSLFEFNIDGDVGKDPNLMTLWFSQPSLGLPAKEYYEEAEILEIYKNTIDKLLLAIYDAESAAPGPEAPPSGSWPPWPWPPWGGDDDDDDDDKDGKKENNTAKATRIANNVVQFETKLAEITQDLDELEDPIATYNPINFEKFAKKLPEVALNNYIATFTPRAFPATVIDLYPPYIKKLSKLLSDAKAETVEAYLLVRATLTLGPRLGTNTEIWKIQRELFEVLTGVKKGAIGDRAEWCVRAVDDALGYASGRFFVQREFAGDSKAKAFNLISNVIGSFKTSLPHLDWMDKNSSIAAAEKADAIKVKVGYPMTPNTENSFSIWSYYAPVGITKSTFFENMLRASTIEKYRSWLQLGRKRDPGAWEMYAQTVNAYFNPPANEIVFPAGILRPPWFEQNWPGYLKYGAAGSIVSHELTHAFDSAGRKYNQEGKLEEWWTNTTSENFVELQNCISDQYSAYTIDDGKGNKVHVNGNLTSGENIADAGIINAFRAWKAQYNTSYDMGGEYLLPGLNYTREQLFFIGFGRTWARNIRPAAAVQRIRTDPHSPTQFRVEGTLANIPEFAKAFDCPVGSKLNPKHQCKLWT